MRINAKEVLYYTPEDDFSGIESDLSGGDRILVLWIGFTRSNQYETKTRVLMVYEIIP